MFFSVQSVSRVYHTPKGELLALKPTTFDVNQGDFVSLLGPSGCGKSTLLYICAGLENATSGKISLGGRKLTDAGKERGMVFQNYTLFPWLTVYQNIRFSLKLGANSTRRLPDGEALHHVEYANHLLEIMGLANFAHRYPRELSGGMKQRVAIARALVNKPDILLMDEPFGALDAQTREEMQELMLILSLHKNTTILFVTHDVEEAVYLSNRILVFSPHPGEIIEEVKVPFPRDRGLDVKLTPEFMRLKRHLLGLLHQGGRTGFDRHSILERLGGSAA